MNPPGDFYRSHQRLPFIGPSGQQALGAAKVLVVGAGGLGCPCLTALSGAGVGTLGIADGDTIATSNLHRQPLYATAEVGLHKAPTAAIRLQAYNPGITLRVHDGWVDETAALSLISQYDVVADCTDNFTTRYLLNDACVQLGKPLVYGAIFQGEGQLTVLNFEDGPTLRCLFPDAEQGSVISCADTGAYNITTAVIGSLMANEVIKIITRHPDILSGRLLQMNLLEGSSGIFSFCRTEEGYQRSLHKPTTDYSWNTTELQERLSAGTPLLLLDVREAAERAGGHLGGLHLPLKSLLNLHEFPFKASDEILVYCQRGQRSRIAVQYLRAKGFHHAFQLNGGYESGQAFSEACH